MEARVRYYAELKRFLARGHASGVVRHRFDVPGSVKDVIEGHGVPHTEVALIVADGEIVDFGRRIGDGDRIAVYPTFRRLDVSSVLRLRPLRSESVAFVADGHLAKLARFLRLLGFDTICDSSWSDDDLVARARRDGRFLLSRDVGLLKRRAVVHGAYVHETDPRRQLAEVVSRLGLAHAADPFSRCMVCNEALTGVAEIDVVDRLRPGTRELGGDFSVCGGCDRVYWEGAHHAGLREIVAEAITPVV